MASSEEIAWAAGLFEGEGSISPSNRKRGLGKGIRLQINMTDLDVLERFRDVVGCGYIYKSAPPDSCKATRGQRKQMWKWYVGKIKDVERTMADFSLWLSPRRLDRYAELHSEVEAFQLLINREGTCALCGSAFTRSSYALTRRFCSGICRSRAGNLKNRRAKNLA